MDQKKRARLAAAGWQVGTVQDFLELSDAEAAMIEIRLQLSNELRKRRARSGITQAKLATLLESSQSRVAKMEAGDDSVSLDLLIHALLVTGETPAAIGRALGRIGA